jgi:predicted alpha-1,6-mannanase (GH76 family)
MRWWQRLASLVVLALASTLAFGSASGSKSEALRIKPRPVKPRPAPVVPRRSAAAHPSLRLPSPPVSVAQAAANAALELAGSGDDSEVRWFPDWGLWGKHDAPPGQWFWSSPSRPGEPIGWNSPYWWQSALDLRTLVRYLEQTRDTSPRYERIIEQTFRLNVRRPHSNMPVNFGNEFMDDTAWWGLAWLEAAHYELNIRHDPAEASRFFNLAEWIANYIWRTPRRCGGLEWQIGFPSDTITNAEFAALAAELAQAREQPGPWQNPAVAGKWLGEAWQSLWWLQHSRLVNLRTGHVYDGFNRSCRITGGSLTYTEGETADALVQMGLATGQRGYLDQAQRFISYALSPATKMTYNGVVQEPCEARPSRCHGGSRLSDSTIWKGVLVDAVTDWSTATASKKYDPFLARQAQAVLDNAASNGLQLTHCGTPHDCQLNFYWSRAIPPSSQLPVGPGSQEAGLTALTDALSASSNYTG